MTSPGFSAKAIGTFNSNPNRQVLANRPTHWRHREVPPPTLPTAFPEKQTECLIVAVGRIRIQACW